MGLRSIPAPIQANAPRVRVWDRVQLLFPATIAIPGTFKLSNTIVQTGGHRRYRLKMRIVVSGAGVSSVNAILILNTFGRIFERQIAVGPFGPLGGTWPVVVNFGEGTAVETNEMGAFIIVGIENLGPSNVTVPEVEFWEGS